MALGKKDGLIALACEKSVFGDTMSEVTCPIPAGMLQPWNAAREAVNEMTDLQEAVTGKHMVDIISKKLHILEQIDRSFKIELAFLTSLTAAGGAQ
eukprot:9797676-Heterocapsa_arctica.AAC.1